MTQFFYPAIHARHAYAMTVDFGRKFENRTGSWTSEGLLGDTGVDGYQIVVAVESLFLPEPSVGVGASALARWDDLSSRAGRKRTRGLMPLWSGTSIRPLDIH